MRISLIELRRVEMLAAGLSVFDPNPPLTFIVFADQAKHESAPVQQPLQ
jgi:hypothetical protein